MRIYRKFNIILFGFFLFLVPANAYAHMVNTSVREFYAGMLHPLTSLEHLLPVIALSLLVSQCGKQAIRWTLMVFPMSLMLGILAGNSFSPTGFFHVANLTALAVLGGMLVAAGRISPRAVGVAAVLVGLILGYRSGIDMAVSNVDYKFIPGVALTGLIIVALFSAWTPVASSTNTRTLRTVLGVFFCGAGVVWLIGYFTGSNILNVKNVGIPDQDVLIDMVKTKNLSLPLIMGTLLTAFIWGAGHALTPGHGKAIVAAYLVGARSTPWHAVYLGLTVTTTHTLGVFCLGLVALFASRYLLPEQLYPWLGAISGIIVVALGVTMFSNRLKAAQTGGSAPSHHHHDDGTHEHHHHEDHSHDHHHDDHGHSHMPPGADGSPVTWRTLLGLGISGGLVPCPSALVVLLAAISFGRTGFGLILVIVFSLGLATVLTTVGLLFVKAGRMMQGRPGVLAMSRYLPVASALVILIIGMAITVGAVSRIVV